MSILITGFEMPKAGSWKTIRIYYDGTCAEPNWQEDCKYIQNCEAVSIPPHGDLIDRDKLIKQARTQFDWNDVIDVEDIINAPAVIPAEEGRKKHETAFRHTERV